MSNAQTDAKTRMIQWLRKAGLLVLVLAGLLFAYKIGQRSAPEPVSSAEPASMPTSMATAGDEHGDHAGHEAEAPSEFVCPMHPQIRQSEEGTCPICHMDLVPVQTDSGGGDGVSLTLSDHAAALAHVRISPVERMPLEREIRVFGRVGTNELGEANITAWTAGRIDRLYVQTTGETVRRGQRLARVYSPELVVAQETLIHARHIQASATEAESNTRGRAAAATVSAAMAELRLFGISDRQIEDLVGDGEADEYVHIYAPADGTVLRRMVSEGDYVSQGTPIVALADLDDVWVQLELYERDLSHVSVGAPVHMRVRGGGEFEGEVAFIDPVLDPLRRIARARVVVPNPDGALRPDSFVEATIGATVLDGDRPPVSVPSSAVLWTGQRSLVYVYDATVSPAVYMPIDVTLGERIGDRTVIEAGVFPGENVVSNGAFRLDASLQIRGGASMMQGTAVGTDNAAAASAGGGHDH